MKNQNLLVEKAGDVKGAQERHWNVYVHEPAKKEHPADTENIYEEIKPVVACKP